MESKLAKKHATKFVEVMFASSRLLKERMHYSSKLCDLSILQIYTLRFLKEKANAQMSEIAEHFHIELPSATSLLNKLVTLQLVERKPDEKDRRLVRISLTEAGNKLLKRALEEKINQIEHMLSYLSEEEQEELIRLLEKLNKRIENKV